MVQKSDLHQFRLVVYPIIYDGFYTSKRWLGMGFLNHQQYEGHLLQESFNNPQNVSMMPTPNNKKKQHRKCCNPKF